MKPVIYITEPIGVDGAQEATEVLFYCGEACRVNASIELRAESDDPVQWGRSADWIPGTVCDECAAPLR